MTDEMMNLRGLLEKSSDAELLREMIGFTAQRLMELEVSGLTGAALGERSPERINHRNGYRDRNCPGGRPAAPRRRPGGARRRRAGREPARPAPRQRALNVPPNSAAEKTGGYVPEYRLTARRRIWRRPKTGNAREFA